GLRDKITDKQNQNEFVPLNKMIEIATQEKINGLPILSPQTAKAAHLIKFLGNAAAHSLDAGVDLGSLSLFCAPNQDRYLRAIQTLVKTAMHVMASSPSIPRRCRTHLPKRCL